MYRRVAIVTDSTACLPPQVAEDLRVTVVQTQIKIGERADDESRIGIPELVHAMRSQLPYSTSPPDPGAFFWAYSDLAAAGVEAIISLHVSSRLSGTFEAACQAAAQVRVPVHVVDTGTCGMSVGYAVMAAAAAADQGGDARKVLETAQHRYRNSTELIYVDTLEYLRRGGRIGATAAMLGSALSMKPLLTVAEGQIAPLDKVMGADRAVRRMVDIAAGRTGRGQVDIAVEHFDAADRAQSLMAQLRKKIPSARRMLLTQVSSSIGAHVGPGALGVTVSPV